MKHVLKNFALAMLVAGGSLLAPAPLVAEEPDRTILPIPEPAYRQITEIDARNAKAPPQFRVKAPKGAPNVVIVLIDDMGFGQPSAFGGPVYMPTAEKLASNGLKYNRFHTTAVCSPTRMALLTGRNHHSCNMGSITETATAFPGQTGVRPQNIAPLAEMLRLNGYSTAQFGKNHETPPWEISPSGPFDRWPTGSGCGQSGGPPRPELPLHHGHDQSGNRVDAVPESSYAGQAVLRLLCPGSHTRSASGPEGVH
jgi:arylsulfatase